MPRCECKIGYVVRFFLLLGLLALIGCGSVPSATIDLANFDSFEPLFVSRHTLQNGSDLSLAFRNVSSRKLTVVEVKLKDSIESKILSREVVLSADAIKSGACEYAITSASSVSDAMMDVEFLFKDNDGRSFRSQAHVPVVDELDSVQIGEDLRTINVFFSTPFEESVAAPTACSINGITYGISGVSSLKTSSDRLKYCISIEMPSPVVKGNGLVAKISLADGRSFGWVGKAIPKFFFGTNQYFFPVRITEAKYSSAGDLEALVYNESSSLKTYATITSVTINGKDVKEDCVLPKLPLVPDRQAYLEDLGLVRIPKSVLAKLGDLDEIDLQIGFNQHDARFGEVSIQEREGLHKIKARRGLRVPIGTANGIYLKDFVCLGNEGLRDPSSFEEYMQRSKEIRRADARLPTYANLLEGRDVDEIAHISGVTDLVVIAPPIDVPGHLGLRMAEYQRYIESISRKPVVVSIVQLRDKYLSNPGVNIRALIAIASGSKGVLTPLNMRKPLFGESKIDEERTVALLGNSVPIHLDFNCDNAGISTHVLYLDPNRLLLLLINEWCVWESAVPSQDFYAYPRPPVRLELELGKEWQESKIVDLATSSILPSHINENGRLAITSSEFSVASAILIDKTKESRFNDAELPLWSELQVASVDRRLFAKTKPFLFEAIAVPGSMIEFDVIVSNAGKCSSTIELVCSSDHLIKAKSDKNSIVPGETATIHVEATVPTGSNYFNEKVAVKSSDRDETDFEIIMGGKVINPIVAAPPAIDFGTVLLGKESEVVVEFQRNVADCKVVGATIEGNSVVLETGSSKLLVKPVFAQEGAFSGSISVDTVVGNGTRFNVRIPYFGVFSNGSLQAHPKMIVATSSKVPFERELNLSAATGSKFAVKRISVDKSWVTISHSAGVHDKHKLIVRVGSQRIGSDATATITIETEQGNIDVPIRIIDLGAPKLESANSQSDIRNTLPHRLVTTKTGHDDSTKVAELCRRIENMVSKYRELELSRDAPNWMLLHATLAFAGSDEKIRANSDVFKLQKQILIGGKSIRPSLFTIISELPASRKIGERFDLQHHPDQALAYLGMSGLQLDDEITISGRKFSVRDAVISSKKDARAKGTSELAWTVMAYNNLMNNDESWINKFGEKVTFPLLVEALMASAADKKICGGTHRLFALSEVAGNKAMRNNNAFKELFAKVDRELNQSLMLLKDGQDSRGGFTGQAKSTGTIDDFIASEILVSGHNLEWISNLLDSKDLAAEWIVLCVEHSLQLLEQNPIHTGMFDTDSSRYRFGAILHSIHGLSTWRTKILLSTKSRG